MLAYHGQSLVRKQGYTHIKPAAVENGTPCNHIPRSYEEYLESPHWQQLKVKSARIWGNNCLICNCDGIIHRHHLFYREKWEYSLPTEIIPLCGACHEATHEDGANKNPPPSSDEDLTNLVIRMVRQIDNKRKLGKPNIVSDFLTCFWSIYNINRIRGFEAPYKDIKKSKKSRKGWRQAKIDKKARIKREKRQAKSRAKQRRRRERFGWTV